MVNETRGLEDMRDYAMKKNRNTNHRWNTADIITLFRIAGTMFLVVLRPISAAFFCVYALTGLTDVLDGWIARRTKTASEFGARLDSVADLLFYSVMLFRILPILWNTLPGDIWYAVAVSVIVRVSSYLVAAVKYRQFAALHTYLNKLTGVAVFFIPFFAAAPYQTVYCRVTCAIAVTAATEELIIHLHSKTYRANTKSIFQKENGNQARKEKIRR